MKRKQSWIVGLTKTAPIHSQPASSYKVLSQGLTLEVLSQGLTLEVHELNREDGANRRFLMVQLPEPTDRHDFKTIADIGKERIAE